MKKIFSLTLILATQLSFAAQTAQGPVRVGNGDDGEDLQSFEVIEDGAIVEARQKAVQLLKSFKIQKIEGLGNLIPEVENTKLYMTKKGLNPAELAKLGAFTSDATGLVYARTMPEPYAPTRFFPAAAKLDESQLIALHIHEALHRALAPDIRENEQVATTITESIVEPNASFDRIEATVARFRREKNQQVIAANNGYTGASQIKVPEKSRLKNPSTFGLEARLFNRDEDSEIVTGKKITSMYLLRSHLYPFGKNESAMGIGIDASVVKTEDDSFMGPLSVGARYRLYTHRDFDIEGFAQVNLNTLSDEELKNSMMGRDTHTVGLTLETQRDYFYIQNDLFYTFESEVEEKVGNVDYTYTFGSILGINLKAGTHYKNFMLGGFAEVLLADNFIAEGGDYNYETGRLRIVSWGPNIEYRKKNYSLSLRGRFILDSSKGASYDYLSDLMGYGVGQGSLQTQVNVFF